MPPLGEAFTLILPTLPLSIGLLSFSALRDSRYSIHRTRTVEFSEAATPPPGETFTLILFSLFPQPRIVFIFCPSRLAASYQSNSRIRVLRFSFHILACHSFPRLSRLAVSYQSDSRSRVLQGGNAAPGEAFSLILPTLHPQPQIVFIFCPRVSRHPINRTREDEFSEAEQQPLTKPSPSFLPTLHPQPRISPRPLPFFAFFLLSGLKTSG